MCLHTCVDFYVFMWGLTPEAVSVFAVVVVGWVCVCESVCVCLHQTVSSTTGLAETQPFSLQPAFLHPPFCESHRWEGREEQSNRARDSSGVFRSLIALSFLLASCSVFTVAGLFSVRRGYVCVSLSLLLSLSVSVSLFHSLNSELQEHRDCVQFDQCPLSLPVSSIHLSLWQAQFVFTKYANDCVCVHLWPGSGFPPLSVSPL